MQNMITSRIHSWRESSRAWLHSVRARWSKLSPSDQAITAGAGVLLVLVAAVGLVAALGEVSRCDQPVCVEVIGPTGEHVHPMAPVQIRVAGDIDRDLAVQALQISNEPPGAKKFEGDILTFRPEWPGFARGVRYQVALALPASVLPEGQGADGFSFDFTTDGKLQVAAVFPPDGSAEVALDASIMLQFNRSVAPLTVVTERGPEEVVAFDPPVEGKGKWLNTSLYTFTPAAPGWIPATRYGVTVKAGLTNDLGGRLEADFPFSFTTLSPDVAAVDPADNSKFVARQPDVTVQFNQPVDHVSAEASFSLTPSGGSPVAGGFLWTDDRTLAFQPAQPLPLEATIEAVVRPGTIALGATATMTAEKRWTFTTVGLPRIVSTDPANGGHSPGGGVSITFSNPMDQESVEGHVTVVPAPLDTPYFSWNPDGLVLYVSFPTNPSSPYRVLLSASATDRYGQPLVEGLDLNFVTDRLRPSYNIFRGAHAGTFNAYLDPKLMVSSVNVDRLDFALYAVDAQSLIIQETNGMRFGPPASGLLRTWSEFIAAPPLDRAVVTTTRLAEAGSTLPEGVYFVRVTSPSASPDWNISDDMFFVVSSVNVVTKWTQRDVLVWLVDMNTGAPLPNVKFELLDRTAGSIRTAVTGDDGVARTDVPPPPDGNFWQGYYVWLQAGGRTALAGTGWNDGIAPWNFQTGVNFQFMPPELVGYLYTDRPIYRPGETVYYKGVVRSDDDANYSMASADDLSVAVRDDQGRLVDTHAVTLSDMGTFNTELALSPEAATGVYSVQLTKGSVPVGPDGKEIMGQYLTPIAFVSFRVAEFRKPEFEANVTTDKEAYANGETINATASADLFFGVPLAGAAVHWKVTAQPYIFTADGYSGYSFSDYHPYYEFDGGPSFESQEFLRGEGVGQTGADGRFSFSLPADISRDPLSQIYTVEATVTDQNQQSVATFIGVPVHKGNFYIGMRPRDYVLLAGSKSVVDLVTLDPEGSAAPGAPVQVSVYLRTWRTVRERDADGEQRYRSEPDDTLVQTISASTGGDGTGSFSFVPPQGGAYYLAAQAADSRGNEIKSSVFTWASSPEYASWFIGNDDLIQLAADKDEYRPGDTAKILVAAPFTDSRGLVTLERGRLRGYQVRDFQTNSDILEVPITSEHVPNIFVGVTLFKPPTPDNPMPQVKFGLVELQVSTDEKQLRISIEPDRDKLGPRETVTYEITTTDQGGNGVPAEVSLALVDLSVLSLQDEFARRPIEAFWSAHSLGVSTGSSFAVSVDRSNELAVNRQQGAGGKGGGGGAGDESRTFFPNTAYWEPALQTNGNGRATVSVTLPDTLTTWRLTARAVTSDTRVGDARNDIVTSKDVIIRPAIPRFLVAGDEASLGAIVHNFTSAALDMTVSLDAVGIEIQGTKARTVSVPAGQDALVRWDTTVPLGNDSANLTFKADGGSASDSVRLVLPVYGLWTPETAGTAGETTSRTSEVVGVPYYVRPDAGELTVRVSPSLASGVDATLQYLQEYPWESAEVTVSRFLPRLALNRAVEKLGLTDLPEGSTSVDALVKRSLQRLYGQQHADGGWGWWIGDDSDPAITAYVLIGLAEARESGFSVDQGVEQNTVTYLIGELDRPRDVVSQQFDLRSYLVYAIARDGRGDLGRSFALAEQRASLGNTAKAWVALAIKLSGGEDNDPRLTGLMTDLQGSAIPSATGNHWEEKEYDPNVFANSVMTTAQVLQAFTALQPEHPLVDGTLRWLMVARKEGHWESPHDTAIALLAITDFMVVRKDAQEAFDYRVALNGGTRLQGSAERGKVQQEDSVVIEMKDLLKDAFNRLDVIRSPAGAGRLYYIAHLRYFTPAEGVEAATYGIGVSHEYFLGDSDTPITEVSLGDTVKVKVTLVAPSDLNFLVLEDFLPAGLEPIDTSLKTTPLEFRRQLVEEQRKAYQISKRWSPFGHSDIRDNRIALFARFVPKGVYEYVYYAQATTAGRFNVPPATAYEQYFPEVWGRSDSGIFAVNAAAPALREHGPMQDRDLVGDKTGYRGDIDATAVPMAAHTSPLRSATESVGIQLPRVDVRLVAAQCQCLVPCERLNEYSGRAPAARLQDTAYKCDPAARRQLL